MKYYNTRWGFEIQLPKGWYEPSLFKRILFFFRYGQQAIQPEFYGPHGSSLKFAVGPISPVPSVERQLENLQRIALKYGHDVVKTNQIEVNGKKHATMISRIPYVGEVKSYSLIFDGMEYLVTGRGDFEQIDSIVKSFKKA